MGCKYCFLVPIFQGTLYVIAFSTTKSQMQKSKRTQPQKKELEFRRDQKIMIATIYIRCRQVKEVLELAESKNLSSKLKKLNTISLFLGMVAVIGVFMLGCFPVHPYIVPHLIGAGAAFNTGLMVLAAQTYISLKIYPTLGNKTLNIIRCVMVLILAVALCLCVIFGGLSLLLFKGDDITQWTAASGGYVFHLISVASEWILVLGVILYLSLYAGEFRSIVLHKPNMDITTA
ncbi:hypothetical protein HUJ05_002313 [Dendroctonus ponderosae]|nr:hypothetical protein HUJ05_002313 [Dendroctonus ponderosae]